MRLGKFVTIMAANPPRAARDDRYHRDLDHRGGAQMPSIQCDLARMDMILGIVEDDRGKAHPFGAFILAECRPHAVEVIALGRGPVALIDDQT